MERDPLLPPPDAAPTPPEGGGVFDRWRKKVRKSTKPTTNQAPASASPEAQAVPDKPQTQRRKLGESIFKLITGDMATPDRPDAQPGQPNMAPNIAPDAQTTPENNQPVLERASRTRRFARMVIRHVLDTADAEQHHGKNWDKADAKPLDTQPLVDAADDLQDATANLDQTVQAARVRGTQATPDFAASPAASSAFETGSFDTVVEAATLASAAGRIQERISTLEHSAEQSRATAVVAVGLGVLAVLVAGHEYFGKKRVEKKLTTATQEIRTQQERITQQETAFAKLQQEQQQATTMPRSERDVYYTKLSEFTHKQADVTREVAREVQEVTQSTYVPPRAEAPTRPEVRAHSEWRRAPLPEVAPRLEPLARVETSDKVELGTSRHGQAAATPLANVATGTSPADPAAQQASGKAPLSPTAMREEALRKARTARLASSAWLYGLLLGGFLVVAAIAFLLLR